MRDDNRFVVDHLLLQSSTTFLRRFPGACPHGDLFIGVSTGGFPFSPDSLDAGFDRRLFGYRVLE